MNEVEIQRRYYADTASTYDTMHGGEEARCHDVALAMMLGFVDLLGVRSILDVGAGTGRAVAQIKAARPHIRVCGVEPVAAMREVGYANGLLESELLDGDAMALPFADGEFDLVAEFAVLHHVPRPSRMVAEMLRVAKTGVFIHDANNFAQGRPAVRLIKQALDLFGLWPLADWVKTRGRGYSISEGDGLAYSYSVFNNYNQIKAQCPLIHTMNTRPAGGNLYRTAHDVAMMCLKD
jgi:ubiquinone/menaquinone biosynthesis C-methylase UbiE